MFNRTVFKHKCKFIQNTYTTKKKKQIFVQPKQSTLRVCVCVRPFFSYAQVQYENYREHVLDLQPAKRMESDCDIIQQLCVSSGRNQHQMENASSFKDEVMSDSIDTASASADNAATVTVADVAAASDISSATSANENEVTVNDGNTMTHRSHFVEIGEFSCGSIFGLGEHMDDRAIVAKHMQVQCLLIPHYWLLAKKQNAGNIWQRYAHTHTPAHLFCITSEKIQTIFPLSKCFNFNFRRTKIYINFTLPSRQEVFEKYLMARKWKSYKKQLIYNSQSRRPQINSTQIHDVPIICRLNNSF